MTIMVDQGLNLVRVLSAAALASIAVGIAFGPELSRVLARLGRLRAAQAPPSADASRPAA